MKIMELKRRTEEAEKIIRNLAIEVNEYINRGGEKMNKVIATFYNKEEAEKWTEETNILLKRANAYYIVTCCPAGGCFEIYLEEK